MRELKIVWDEDYPDFWGIEVDGHFWPAADDVKTWLHGLLHYLNPDDNITSGPETNDRLHQMLAQSCPFPEVPL